MFPILEARSLAPDVVYFRIEAPRIARKRRAGQFVILRVKDGGERIPLTIADSDPDEGWIALIVQGVGKTTKMLNALTAGDTIADVAGPLGEPSHIENFGTAVSIGGGVGAAIAYPTAVALKDAGNEVISILGGRTRELVILENEMREICDEVLTTTDDGSYGIHGRVTDPLAEMIRSGRKIDFVLAIGPIPMMKAVAETTRPHGIRTVVSLNPIMVDGTGMCGGCRVTIGDETKFACVDGPEFDAHLVDFDTLSARNRAYLDFEHHRLEQYEHRHGAGEGLFPDPEKRDAETHDPETHDPEGCHLARRIRALKDEAERTEPQNATSTPGTSASRPEE
ncbi:MAG: sulfide/dihydroorotate dehydrogenase-like FAD/NAD-binding protein [Candidatus Eisenbacteria bacterium]|nr:sulfide/dihydroorotate dehydrogenase-like FAD/NAD-binding protein [Candidatus Eisenbacteria bacterium]